MKSLVIQLMPMATLSAKKGLLSRLIVQRGWNGTRQKKAAPQFCVSLIYSNCSILFIIYFLTLYYRQSVYIQVVFPSIKYNFLYIFWGKRKEGIGTGVKHFSTRPVRCLPKHASVYSIIVFAHPLFFMINYTFSNSACGGGYIETCLTLLTVSTSEWDTLTGTVAQMLTPRKSRI